MSHDETSGTVTRKERRKAFGKRQAAPRYVFNAEAHVRKDWTVLDVIEHLEDRAKGYNGILRQLLCTATAMLRQQEVSLAGYQSAYEVDAAEFDEVVNSMRETSEVGIPTTAPIIPANISPNFKRNQQPGRLSGGERKALKDFVDNIVIAHANTMVSGLRGEELMVEAMAEGRALLAKVRKRALGPEVVNTGAEETVDASALMPVGVEEMSEADRSATNKGHGA